LRAGGGQINPQMRVMTFGEGLKIYRHMGEYEVEVLALIMGLYGVFCPPNRAP